MSGMRKRILSTLLAWSIAVIPLSGGFCTLADVTWTDGIKGQYRVVSEVPADSLIAGKTPTKDSTTDAWASDSSGGTPAVLTDGKLAVSQTTELAFFKNCWGPKHFGFTYDLGKNCVLDSFLVGSDYGNGQQQYWVRIYVSENLSDLYDETHLVAEVKGLTRQEKNVVVRLGEGQTATGRYVGFGCYSSADNIQDNNGQNYAYYGILRLGEFAVYGEPILYAEGMDTLGAQLRAEDVLDNFAMRFGFQMNCTGVTKNETTHERILTDASVLMDGQERALTDFGAVVTSRDDLKPAEITVDTANGDDVIAVSAKKIYEVDDVGVTFVVTVVGIPRTYGGCSLIAVPYISWQESGKTVTVYGEPISRSVWQLKGVAEANACVEGASVFELSEVPTEVNLLDNRDPVTYSSTPVKFAQNTMAMLTDDMWQGLNVKTHYVTDENGNSTANCAATNVGEAEVAFRINGDITTTGKDGYTASSMVFDLGEVTAIGSFAYGNPDNLQDAWVGTGNPVGTDRLEHPERYRRKDFRMHMGDLYVSNDPDTLYTEENKVVAWDYLQNGTVSRSSSLSPLNCHYILDVPVEGRYVGFKFYVGEENSWGWWYLTRLTELAVYADNGGTVGAKMAIMSTLPTESNRLAGATPADAAGQPVYAVELTDGVWQQATGENAGVTLAAVADTTATAKPGKKAVSLVYDLGKTSSLHGFGIGYDRTQTAVSTAGEFYVADTVEALFAETSRYARWNRAASASAPNRHFTLVTTAVGRYVGFKFYVNEDVDSLKLAELAVYGEDYVPWTLEIGDWSDMDTSVLDPLSKTGGSLIIDTDIGADCDDCGALAVVFQLLKKYDYTVAGMVNSTSCAYGNGALDAIASYYGYAFEATGYYNYRSFKPNDTQFNKYLTENMTTHRSEMVPSTQYYHDVLTAAADDSVVLLTLGGFNAVADFLKAEPELFAQKVRLVVSMGGAVKDANKVEYNIQLDPSSAGYFAANCPCPIVYDTVELTADCVYAGYLTMDWNNPVAVSFYLLQNGDLLRSCCDISAAQVAIEGLTDQYTLSEAGTMTFDEQGKTVFTPSTDGKHYYLKKQRSNYYLGMYLSEIMQQKP